jgi:hypothetical protein
MLHSCGFEGKIEFQQDFSFLNHIHWLQNDFPQKNQKIATELTSWNTEDSKFSSNSTIMKNWFLKVNQEYKKLLCKNSISEILSFTGKIKNL